jgi:hypothetical protein
MLENRDFELQPVILDSRMLRSWLQIIEQSFAVQ